ncbi:Transmembrane_domain-containing protein [Hexamita inflata]|uniref:Transmembrane domain-containing protein n=1 Tax=Hexamita inflata TaxID=28002 RepID=A0AA86PNT6_9EUKA|nr:Transmembrane domain-containing protein [Hexamita inflata]
MILLFKGSPKQPEIPEYMTQILNYIGFNNKFEFKRLEYEEHTQIHLNEKLHSVVTECGPIQHTPPPVNQIQMYYQQQNIINNIFKEAENPIFELNKQQIDGALVMQASSHLYTLQAKYQLQLPVNITQLLQFNQIPELCVTSLHLLTKLSPQLTPDEINILILCCLTQTIGVSGYNDHLVIAVQHYLSKLFNDRSPNQKAAMCCGWSLVNEQQLLDPKLEKMYYQCMIASDTKSYETIYNCVKYKNVNSSLEAISWIISHSSALIKDQSFEIMKKLYSEKANEISDIFKFIAVDFDQLNQETLIRSQKLLEMMGIKYQFE